MSKKNIKILVAHHKPGYICENEVFLPIQVGKVNSDFDLSIQGDDTGDNISRLNPNYCELTAMYWAWKNLKNVDYIGLCHYRRYFDFKSNFVIKNLIIKNLDELEFYEAQYYKIERFLKKYDIIVPKANVYPYNLRINYSSEHLSTDFFVLYDVIKDLYPEYCASYEYIMEQNNNLFPYNMFVTNYSIFENYCQWLFDILFEVEKRIDISNYSLTQSRIFGYMSERLLNVYIYKNNFKVKTLPVILFDNELKNEYSLRYLLRFYKTKFIFKLSSINIAKKEVNIYEKRKSLYLYKNLKG
ncbi:DUF4422 domain-containing protein [Weeksellaceae bacterium A-14]